VEGADALPDDERRRIIMRKHSAILVLGMGALEPMHAAGLERCGELHYARLAGAGFLAYRCSDESCWLRKPAVSDGPEGASESMAAIPRSKRQRLNLSPPSGDSPVNEGKVPSDKKGENQ